MLMKRDSQISNDPIVTYFGIELNQTGGRSEKKAKKNAEIETLVTEGSSSIAVGGGGDSPSTNYNYWC